ncbi:MAG: response regulator [Planctomycetota bacterium]|nr:response regulator [Planctomycetota bacterium]
MAWILLVDDEPSVRGALAAQLRALRHRCVEAEDGLQALERLHEREFDLVMTDVMMPKLNGFQLLDRALPFIEGRTPVVVLSSVEDRDSIQVALDAGAYDWLTKPADADDVARVLEGGLRRRAENVRLIGRYRGRGGPVPKEALGPRAGDVREAPPSQPPAGVPAFRSEPRIVAVPRPQVGVAVPERPLGWWRRVATWLRGAA